MLAGPLLLWGVLTIWKSIAPKWSFCFPNRAAIASDKCHVADIASLGAALI
jgi:hypothetical protein